MSGADHEGLQRLGADVRRAQPDEARADRLRQRAAVIAAARPRPAGPRWSMAMTWAGLGAIAVAVAAAFWLQRPVAPEPPQTPAVDSMAVADADTNTPLAAEHPPSQKTHQPATPATPSASQEPLELAAGTTELAPKTTREVLAGPHHIEVGTNDRVTLTWTPTLQLLEVRVEDGSVDLIVATQTHTVTAGYQARVQDLDVTITSTRAIAKAPDKAVFTPEKQAWKRLAKEGRYVDALAQATRAGALKRTGSIAKADLKLLADIARLGGAPEQSVAVLQTLRRRFPKSREARRAAFYLGRQAEREARLQDATSWYRTYLEGKAQGSLRAEARGRLLGVLRRRREHSAARSVARQVLEEDPRGAYGDLARKTLGEAP